VEAEASTLNVVFSQKQQHSTRIVRLTVKVKMLEQNHSYYNVGLGFPTAFLQEKVYSPAFQRMLLAVILL